MSADPVVLDGSQTFFSLTIDGSLELAQMAVAKLYVRTKGAVRIPVLLVRAASEIGSFQRGDRQEITKAITKGENTVRGLESMKGRTKKHGKTNRVSASNRQMGFFSSESCVRFLGCGSSSGS